MDQQNIHLPTLSQEQGGRQKFDLSGLTEQQRGAFEHYFNSPRLVRGVYETYVIDAFREINADRAAAAGNTEILARLAQEERTWIEEILGWKPETPPTTV